MRRLLPGFVAVCRMLCSVDLHVENMLCFNGFPVPVDGFRAAYRLGQANQEELLELVHGLHDFPVRVVIIATRIYASILRRSRMWKWVTMPDRSTAIRNALLESISEEQRRDFMNIEVDSLLEGDVPYFYARVDSTAMLYPDGVAAEDYFALSPRDNAEQCIRLLSEEDMEFHCQLFRLSTCKVVRPNPQPVKDAPAEPLLTEEECHTRAEKLAWSAADELLT